MKYIVIQDLKQMIQVNYTEYLSPNQEQQTKGVVLMVHGYGSQKSLEPVESPESP
jgi:uncharacterized membrane protein YukC